MKLRNHISLVVCLVVALASHYLGSAVFAQQASAVHSVHALCKTAVFQ